MKRNPGGPLSLLLAAVLALCALPAAATDDFTFLLISDPHVGSQNPKAVPPVTPQDTERQVREARDLLLPLAHAPYPARGPFRDRKPAPVPAEVKGLLIAGDLTDGAPERAAVEAQWKTFEDIFPRAGAPGGGARVPVWPAFGNHDGDPAGPVRQGLVARNRAALKAGLLAALSENGIHYAVRWGDVHVICVNLYPADAPDAKTPFRFGDGGKPGGWNDPQGALTFLTNYLQRTVGASGQPVLILQHYGFDGFSLNDWNWWTPVQRRAYYDALKDFNVLAILHGHDHAAAHYRWPDPQGNPQEVKLLFGDTPPADLRSFDVLSAGRLAWVLRIQDGEFLAMHHNGREWTSDPGLMLAKPLRPRTP